MPRRPRARRRAATAWKNAASLAGSLRPGSASVPLAVSTANGRVAAIASATFSGVSPPESTSGGVASVELGQRPVEALAGAARGDASECASSRWKSVWNGPAAPRTWAASRTRAALITLQPVRRAASRQ